MSLVTLVDQLFQFSASVIGSLEFSGYVGSTYSSSISGFSGKFSEYS